MNNPLISVITVSYNAATIIEETILSVVNQTYPNVEYIVIDGGSTDGTVDIIKKYADRLAYWVSEPDKGIYDAMNKGMAIATGNYINFMNAGDTFGDNTVLGTCAETLKNDTTIDILYGDNYRKNYKKYNDYLRKARKIRDLRKSMVFCHQSSIIRLSYHKDHPFDTRYRALADYNFFRYAYFTDRLNFYYINIPISRFDMGCGISKNNFELTYKEMQQILGNRANPLSTLMWNIKLFCRRILVSIQNR